MSTGLVIGLEMVGIVLFYSFLDQKHIPFQHTNPSSHRLVCRMNFEAAIALFLILFHFSRLGTQSVDCHSVYQSIIINLVASSRCRRPSSVVGFGFFETLLCEKRSGTKGFRI